MRKLSYSNWMRYIHNTLKIDTIAKISPKVNKNALKKLAKMKVKNPEIENKFGVIGNRTAKQIQAEIDHLQKVDTNTTNKVRATYSITK